MKACVRLLLVSVLFVTAAAADSAPCGLGAPEQKARVWSGDFDGDGVADRLWIVPPATARPAARRQLARDPWRDRQQAFDPAAMALVLESGGGTPSAACIVIQNRRFFATPIWDADDKPVRILRRSDPEAQAWRRVARHWRGDGILLGTEAGVDVLLYRDGRRYRIAYGSEAP
jgi:hypothetical protein